MRHHSLGFLAIVCLLAADGTARADEFPLKNGDIWVMAGDSITAQHLHSNYIEAFCYARYPKLTFRFRNSGVGGDTIPRVLARFDWDVAAWKPTIVSVELGMNDKGGSTTPQYVANMKLLSDRIRATGARPVFLTASPVNDGSTSGKLTGGNARLHEYASALKTFADKEEAPFADQFHQVLDIWGKNKPREVLANAMPALKGVAQDEGLVGVEYLRAFLDAQAKQPNPPVSMMGDPVHPGPPGQLMMAAALLKELGAEGFVSSATIDAKGKIVDAKGCEIQVTKSETGKLEFDRLDECLPFPIPDEARAVLPLYPTILDLSRHTLTVTGLKGESYTLKLDGTAVATLSGKELEKGVNLTSFAQGSIAAQGKAVLAAVAAKEALVGQWRALSKTASAPDATAEAKAKLADLTKQIEEADGKIRVAARAKKLRFEIVEAK